MLPREAALLERPALDPARPLNALGLALVVAAAILAACGDDDESKPAASGSTELSIFVNPEGSTGAHESASFSCPGAEADICAAVDALPDDPAAPVPPATPCTEIYGGPDVVTIEGTLDGESVDARLTRANGCEIARFERFLPVLEALFPDYEPGSAMRP